MKQSYRTPEGIEVTFDDDNLVADSGLLLVATLVPNLVCPASSRTRWTSPVAQGEPILPISP
ncbi:MAG: hypothetical protein M1350_02085 [Actinobacteria bacterium]|nr:hypothetical protein [Actinomycetota bacterium]